MRRSDGWVLALAVLGCSLAIAQVGGSTLRVRQDQRPAGKAGAEPSEALQAVLLSQQAAWNRGDIASFLLGYWNSPELTFSSSEGIVRGYDGLLERYQKSYPDRAAMGELDFHDLEIRSLGPDAALVVGHWRLKRSIGNTGGVFTLVFRRFPTGWRIVHDHTSVQKQTL